MPMGPLPFSKQLSGLALHLLFHRSESAETGSLSIGRSAGLVAGRQKTGSQAATPRARIFSSRG